MPASKAPKPARSVPGALTAVLAVASAAVLAAGQVPAQQQSRDRQELVLPMGLLAGVVVEAGAGHAVEGVRLRLTGGEIRGTRTATSDDDGQFLFADLPPGRYTLSASRPGYVDVIYGQRDPGNGRPGTPIELVAGQQIKDLDVPLPRGGVITGAVFDEKGRPVVETRVRAYRWTMRTGERRLEQVGDAETDDRGYYRIFGLAPGQYVVNAIPRTEPTQNFVFISTDSTSGAARVVAAGGTVISSGGAIQYFRDVEAATAPASPGEPSTGYAPIYYPGTLDPSSAATIDVGVSEERSAIDLRLERVPLARVEGGVLIPPDVRMSNIRVRLFNATGNVPGVSNPSARVDRDGRFTFNNVAPGQYRAVASVSVRNPPAHAISAMLDGVPLPSERTSVRFWAAADVGVYGPDVPPVTLVMQPGMAVSGQVIFDGSAPPADQRRVRLTIAPAGQYAEITGAGSVSTNLAADGRFRFLGVVPGEYLLRVSSGAGGWWAKSAVANGRDTLDFNLEVAGHENVNGLMVTLTQRPSSLTGTLLDSLSRPTSDYMVILFPADPQYWLPRSRRIHASRASTSGQFTFGGLPPGRYRLAAVTPTEPGMEYDPQFLQQLLGASMAITLNEGETQVQTLRVGGS